MERGDISSLPITRWGGSQMVKGDLWHEIHSRYKLKESKKAIARSLGLDVRTVRRILRQQRPEPYRRSKTSQNLLEPYKDHIQRRLAALGYCARSLYEELQQMGYPGSYDTIKVYIRPLRRQATLQATVRFETPPGRQAQVDWGQCWTLLEGKRIQIHLFVITLGYSRRMWALGTRDEKLPTFLRCHQEAFDHFEGVPHEILYDNPKTVVLSRDFAGRQIQWNPTFWDFCGYYGFRPWAHRPYRAQTKGKVESGIKYVKRFLRGKAFASLEHLNTSLMSWNAAVADQRIHGTTHQKPIELFEQEKVLLLDHRGRPPYRIQERAVRHVSRDCLVSFETNRYSVPFRLVGQPVEVQSEGELIRIYQNGQLLATHPRCPGTYQVQLDQAHYWGLLPREPIVNQPFRSQIREEEVQVRDLALYEALVEGGTR